MRKEFPVFLTALALAFLLSASPTAQAQARDVAGLTVADAGGHDHPLRELLAGQPVTLVNFWAVWCAPCREELPLLLEGHLLGRYNLIAINLGDPPRTVATYLEQHDIEALPNYFLSPRQAGGLPIFGLPTTLVMDGQGTLTARYSGQLNAATLAELVGSGGESP